MNPLLLVNPRARLVETEPDLVPRLVRCLETHSVPCDLLVTTHPGHATELTREAVQQGRPAVIVAGGDGSVNEVVNGLLGSSVALGVIPLGTGNALGHYLGLEPGDLKAACELIQQRNLRPLDVGRLNGRHFANMAGVGLDAQVAAQVGRVWKRLLGGNAFVGQFLQTVFSEHPWHFWATLDAQEMEGCLWALFVCNSSQYTWRVSFTPRAQPDDGLLDFIFLEGCRRDQLLRISVEIFARGKSAEQQPYMQVLRGTSLELRTEPPVPWQVEGEVGGLSPVHCELLPAAIRILGPPRPSVEQPDAESSERRSNDK
jgi:diacylglycerol kinase (ATP)